jgi:hypothetical protein
MMAIKKKKEEELQRSKLLSALDDIDKDITTSDANAPTTILADVQLNYDEDTLDMTNNFDMDKFDIEEIDGE